MLKYKGIPIEEIVNDKEWQTLRKSFLGTWMKTPNINVIKLRMYLGDIKNTSEVKLVRVYNYLTGTGFRSGKIKGKDITKLKDEVKYELDRRK